MENLAKMKEEFERQVSSIFSEFIDYILPDFPECLDLWENIDESLDEFVSRLRKLFGENVDMEEVEEEFVNLRNTILREIAEEAVKIVAQNLRKHFDSYLHKYLTTPIEPFATWRRLFVEAVNNCEKNFMEEVQRFGNLTKKR